MSTITDKVTDIVHSSIDWITYSRKNAIITCLIAGATLGGIASTPFIRTAYKGHKASQAIEETSQGISSLEAHIKDAQKTFDNNKFLFLSDEQYMYSIEISKAEGVVKQVHEPFAIAQKKYASKQYDDVRKMLDSDFDLKKGEKKRLTPLMIAKDGDERITNNLGQIKLKVKSRNEVVKNENTLMALFAKPRTTINPEREHEHAHLDDITYELIPLVTVEQAVELSTYPKGLQNALGFKLYNQKSTLNHILITAEEPRIGQKAQAMYDKAVQNYTQAKPLNDAMLFYRAKEHDGTFTQEAYMALLAEQQKPLDLILKGDTALQQLKQLYEDLHTQYYRFISGHSKEKVQFSHLDLFADEDESSIKYTDGFKFYYDITTVTPKGNTNTETIYVGEKDQNDNGFLDWNSHKTWDYNDDEQEGYLREYKPLHSDTVIYGGEVLSNGKIIYKGIKSPIKPFETCNPNVVELEKSE